jgi:hypothetical protein
VPVRGQITGPEPLGEPASLDCGASAELLVSTGALEDAGPLAESEVSGVVVGDAEVGDVDGDGEVDGEVDGDVEVVGVGDVGGLDEDGGLAVDGSDGVVAGPLLVPRVPLGESDGSAISVGVGSSEVPYVPSGPGSVGRLVAAPVSAEPSSFFGTSAPRLPSFRPWLADGLTPTCSDGVLASFSEVAPSVTTVPSTATSSAPEPTATRLRRARPLRPPRALCDDGDDPDDPDAPGAGDEGDEAW